MFDQRLRKGKERALGPGARVLAPIVPPLILSGASLLLTLAAAGAAWAGLWLVAAGLWLASRLLDGLDGAVARERRESSDIGGFTDIFFDTIGYAAIPLGIAANLDDRTTWIAVAVLMASFYLNTVSWTYPAALLEKRAAGADRNGETTSTTMPTGLVEGAETIVLYTLMLLLPQWATTLFWLMAVAVAVTAIDRFVRTARVLR